MCGGMVCYCSTTTTTKEGKMIKAGDTFVTSKSKETVTALSDPEPKGNGWSIVLVKTLDGRERYTTIPSE